MAEFDFTEMFRRIGNRETATIAAAARATDEFGEHVLGQAQQLAPIGGGSHSPNDPAPGTLVGSATAEPAVVTAERISKKIGFNTVYAAVQHEHLDFGHDHGQAKYLEIPLRNAEGKFPAYVAEKVKAVWDGSLSSETRGEAQAGGESRSGRTISGYHRQDGTFVQSYRRRK